MTVLYANLMNEQGQVVHHNFVPFMVLMEESTCIETIDEKNRDRPFGAGQLFEE